MIQAVTAAGPSGGPVRLYGADGAVVFEDRPQTPRAREDVRPRQKPVEDQEARQRRFLAAYGASKSLTRAARWAKIHRQTHYDWLRDDPTYKARFDEADRKATRTLEDEAVRRAHEGLRKAVRYKGRVVGFETEFSDRLMELLLKAGDPEKYRERVDQRHSGPDGKPIVSLEALRDWMRNAPPEGD